MRDELLNILRQELKVLTIIESRQAEAGDGKWNVVVTSVYLGEDLISKEEIPFVLNENL